MHLRDNNSKNGRGRILSQDHPSCWQESKNEVFAQVLGCMITGWFIYVVQEMEPIG